MFMRLVAFEYTYCIRPVFPKPVLGPHQGPLFGFFLAPNTHEAATQCSQRYRCIESWEGVDM